MPNERACRGCGRKVIFARDSNGKVQCLDAVSPVYLVEFAQAHGEPDTCTRATTAFVSHFVTCPQREQFRKPKEGP